ncbi:MAG TPA: homoserine O-succinyltransferase [Methylocella sp.]|nr:homoserine O-succinyltransferase [Methylocella sp.]
MSAVVTEETNTTIPRTRPADGARLLRPMIRQSPEPVEIGLINNMPDTALEATERQFSDLLRAAAGGIPLHLTSYAMPGIARTEKGQHYVNSCYAPIADLWDRPIDALIITGTEPRMADLRDEAFWTVLGDVLDWAEDHTVSTIVSCLAAHAAVLHFDGIERHPLPDKCFGVFEQDIVGKHPAVECLPPRFRIPHSRWNEVRYDALQSCGYQVVTHSADAGVDLFIKQRKALFLFFQGHPEYEPSVLLKEYKRDVGRFLRAERQNYPNMPKGYFDAATITCLARFRERALGHPREELLAEFPALSDPSTAFTAQTSPAVPIYRNWLSHIFQRKAERRFSPV